MELDDECAANSGVVDGGEVRVAAVGAPPIVAASLVCELVAAAGAAPPLDERVARMRPADLEGFVASGLRRRHVCVGNTFAVPVYGTPVRVRVAAAAPSASAGEAAGAAVYVLAETTCVRVRRGGADAEADAALAHESQELLLRPAVTFADVGGLDAAVAALREAVLLPLERPELFAQFGVKPPRGVLLHGPSGTGKTLLAHAAAGSCARAAAIQISGAEMMSRYVGESEAKLREVFRVAVEHAPAVVIVDEIDVLCPARDDVCDPRSFLLSIFVFSRCCCWSCYWSCFSFITLDARDNSQRTRWTSEWCRRC